MRALRAASGVPFCAATSSDCPAPSAYLGAGVLLPVFSVGYSAMSRRVTAGGGSAPYVRAALG